ncbi:MAG: DUF1365 domain-containing protein [Hyphomonadaceae bacterium]|nr:DUF1365 domain-containing protein [Hyphomonadaceae bacterium]
MIVARAPAAAYEGQTTHVRFAPFERRFSYRLAQILVDIDRIADVSSQLKLLSYNRFNLFSFHDRDHGDRSGGPLRPWAENLFGAAGVTLEGGRIDLLCFPRMFGFVFNPLSLYFGHDREGRLRGIIYEVNNTFGETHAYVAPVADAPIHTHHARKLFHVSPLLAVEGDYHFRIVAPGRRFRLVVDNLLNGVRQHSATLVGEARPLTDAWLGRILFTMPLMTLQVIFAIHWQALLLFLRGARYHRRPPRPEQPTSLVDTSARIRAEPKLVDHGHE